MADINPTQAATQLADAFVAGSQSRLTARTAALKAQTDGVTQLQKSISDFRTSLLSLNGKPSALVRSAVLSADGIGKATASSKAQPGNYSFFVEQMASASQVNYAGIAAVPVTSSGTFQVSLAGGGHFSVDLSVADRDGDGQVSPVEMTQAINNAAGNQGKVSAMLVTNGGQTSLMLASSTTGADQAISIDASGVADAGLKTALSAPKVLVQAQDAVVWLGAKGTGLRMQQASNTFAPVDGISVTFSRAMRADESPVGLTVATSNDDTTKNVQSVVDAYNTLKAALDKLQVAGSATVTAGPFANDSSVRALRDQMSSLVRQKYNGFSLMDMGVRSDRNGVLTLDATRLQKQLAANPASLDGLLKGPDGQSGLLTSLKGLADRWGTAGSGLIAQRQGAIQRSQKALNAEQARITTQHDQAYQRYLEQFSRLQSIQSQMANTNSILDGLAAR